MHFCLCPAVQAHICCSQPCCQSSQLSLFIFPQRGRKHPRQSPAKRKKSNHTTMEYCHYFCYSFLFFFKHLSDVTGTAGIARRLQRKKACENGIKYCVVTTFSEFPLAPRYIIQTRHKLSRVRADSTFPALPTLQGHLKQGRKTQ